jgi:transmembrane sensor
MSTPVRELRRIGEIVSREQDGALAEREGDGQAEARARFLDAAARGPARRTSRRAPLAWVMGAAGAVAAAAVVVLLLRGREPSFGVGADRGGVVGSELAAPAAERLPLRFSDGSNVELQPGARARVASLDAGLAHVVLEGGEARFALSDRGDRAWSIDAGDVHLRPSPGAHLVLAFDVPAAAVDVTLEEGSAEVIAPCGQQSVQAGNHVHVTCAAPAVVGPPASGATTSSAAPLPDEAPSSSSSQAPNGARAGADWRKLAADARYREAVDAAVAVGFDRECAAASAGDLLALGDAARLAGDASHAAAAYGALRRRFPSDARASVGAFDLGKIAFDARGAYAEAARWFDTYLSEQPGGALAREALGRSMEAHWRSGDGARARELAGQYMQRFPGGPHEDLARRIVAE